MADYAKLAVSIGFGLDPGGDHYWIPIDLLPKKYHDYMESSEGWQLDGMYSAGWADDGESYYDGWHIDRDDFRRLVDNGDLLVDWLVRRTVREKCEAKGLELSYHYCRKIHTIELVGDWIMYDVGGCGEPQYQTEEKSDTEEEAYAQAAIWLHEREGK